MSVESYGIDRVHEQSHSSPPGVREALSYRL